MNNPLYIFEDGTSLKNREKIYRWILDKNSESKIINVEILCKELGATFLDNLDSSYILVAVGQGGKIVLNYLKKYYPISNRVCEIGCERQFVNEKLIGYKLETEQLKLLPSNSTVVLFEDAIDTGGTISFISDKIYERQSEVIRICSIFNIGSFKSEKLKVLYQNDLLNTENLFSTRHLIFGEKGKNFHSKIIANFFDYDIQFEHLVHEELEDVN